MTDMLWDSALLWDDVALWDAEPIPPGLPTLPQFEFIPPVVYDIPPFLSTTRGPQYRLARYRNNLPRGRSVLKNSGVYTILDYPTDTQVAAADIAYIGGHIYHVDETEANALSAAGFITTLLSDIITPRITIVDPLPYSNASTAFTLRVLASESVTLSATISGQGITNTILSSVPVAHPVDHTVNVDTSTLQGGVYRVTVTAIDTASISSIATVDINITNTLIYPALTLYPSLTLFP